MRIALVGGTGDIGQGLALRWGAHTDHDLVIGSRNPEKARRFAREYEEEIATHGSTATIRWGSNVDAVDGAHVVVLSVPPQYVTNTIESVGDSLSESAVVVSPAVNMARDDDGFHFDRPATADSMTAVVSQSVPDNTATVGGFHNLSADRLADLNAELHMDTLLVADDRNAAETVGGLAEEIPGLRAVYAGPLTNAPEVEGITPLLINLALINDGMHHVGIRFR